MVKITKESIDKHLIPLGWYIWNNDNAFNKVYSSENKRYALRYTNTCNICDENGCGWELHVDDSKFCNIACCEVEFIEQIFTIMTIYDQY